MISPIFEAHKRESNLQDATAMIIDSMWGFILLGITLVVALPQNSILHGSNAFLLSERGPTPRRCVYSKIYNMLQARCADLNLSEIPPNLQKDIQILDISINRLRELTDETLAPFTSLSYLYIMDNFILKFGDGAFSQLKNLQVLDMTKNGFSDFPKNILALPQLKKLYLGSNNLEDVALNFTEFAAESNIELLDLSFNFMTKLPKLGYLSQLKHLNVSKNKIGIITAKEIAMFCSLEVLDLSENPIVENCNCHEINAWIESRRIKMNPAKLKCSYCSSTHGNNSITNETLKTFEACQNVVKMREETVKARTTWIIVASSVGVFLICLFISLYCIHKRNKTRKMRSGNNKELALHNGDDELLNGKHIPEHI
ncbi:hypothetical protein PV327_007216 [Microctonus hyperodae]|uniref:Uncharacterized protein n=2 Tax=Microctonus hyperodae TaxID=165561 RepID=A0AA39F5W5_MICHY|nr:hypothetical protein PV327_007216 [Microctonus hyperodae]